MNIEQIDIVLEAAERRARELLDQASKYERLGQQKVADETFDEHYRPLRDAINAVRAGTRALES